MADTINVKVEEDIVNIKVENYVLETENFTQLKDVPQNYDGQKGKILKVKDTEDGLEFTQDGFGY